MTNYTDHGDNSVPRCSENKTSCRKLRRRTEKCLKPEAEFWAKNWCSSPRTRLQMKRLCWCAPRRKTSGRKLRRCTEKCLKPGAEFLGKNWCSSPRTRLQMKRLCWCAPRRKTSDRKLRRCTEKCLKPGAEFLGKNWCSSPRTRLQMKDFVGVLREEKQAAESWGDAQRSAWNREQSSWGRTDAPLQELVFRWKTLLVCSEKKNKRQKAEEMHREVLETGSRVLGEELMLLSKNSSSDERLCWCAPRRKTSGRKLRRCTEKCLKPGAKFLGKNWCSSPRTRLQMKDFVGVLREEKQAAKLRRCTEKCLKPQRFFLEQMMNEPDLLKCYFSCALSCCRALRCD